ncbi:MAG: hypothetical protein U0169_04650 [Polyangiaceae bacterium]
MDLHLAGWTLASVLGLAALSACGSETSSAPSDGGTSATSSDGSTSVADAATVDLAPGPETPPTNGPELETWLAAGHYKSWACEPAPHASRRPSAHAINRICSNALVASFTGTGERPAGSAGVKELYDATGTDVVGYAVYLKTKPTSAGGANWYWYERLSKDAKTPYADGLGVLPDVNSKCVSCHEGAGSDAAHTPTPGASDQVYTQVK